MGGPLKSIHFQSMDLGQVPLQLGSMLTREVMTQTADGEVKGFQLTIDVVYGGDACFSMAFKGTSVGISEVKLFGKLVVEAPQLLPAPPFLAGVAVYFANPPDVSLQFTGVTKILDLSVLNRKIRKVIQQQMSNVLVLPNCIAVPLDKSDK